MLHTLQICFLLYITYAFLGWCIEVFLKYLQYHRFINRGFLIGPYCPIYGRGALLITLLLNKYRTDPIALFVMGMVICSILEYMTSFIAEKIFHARWWDYSTKKFNINGRICLETMVPFGIGGVLIVYFINPFLIKLFNLLNPLFLNILTIVILVIFILDNIISLIVLIDIKKDNKFVDKDNTEEISKKVLEHLTNSNYLEKRLLFAFPNFKNLGNSLNKIRTKINEQKEKYNNKEKKVRKKTDIKIQKAVAKFKKKKANLKEKSKEKIKRIDKKKQK